MRSASFLSSMYYYSSHLKSALCLVHAILFVRILKKRKCKGNKYNTGCSTVHVLRENRAKPYTGEVVTRVDVTYRATRESAAFFCAADAYPIR